MGGAVKIGTCSQHVEGSREAGRDAGSIKGDVREVRDASADRGAATEVRERVGGVIYGVAARFDSNAIEAFLGGWHGKAAACDLKFTLHLQFLQEWFGTGRETGGGANLESAYHSGSRGTCQQEQEIFDPAVWNRKGE